MAANGWSPATRVFEAAGVGACLISDRWEGFEEFLTPGSEVLLADDGAGIADIVRTLDPGTARRIGAAARERVAREHTYARRAEQLDDVLRSAAATAYAMKATHR